MARSSADDLDLRRSCEAAIDGSKQKVVLSMRVSKSRSVWGKSAKLGRQMAKPRVPAITTKCKGPKIKGFLRFLKYSSGGVLEDNTSAGCNQVNIQDGPATATARSGSQVTVEKDLVSQAEEEDMEPLLDTYVMGIGEAEVFSERLKVTTCPGSSQCPCPS